MTMAWTAAAGRRVPFGKKATKVTIRRTVARERIVAFGLRKKKNVPPVETSSPVEPTAEVGVEQEGMEESDQVDVDIFESLAAPVQAPSPPSSGATFPPMFWIGVGVALTVLWTKLVNAAKPKLQQMAFQQMMKAMANQSGTGGMPGMGGFPGPTGMPGMGGFPGMTGMPGMAGFPGSTGMPGMGGMQGTGSTPGTSSTPGVGGLPNVGGVSNTSEPSFPPPPSWSTPQTTSEAPGGIATSSTTGAPSEQAVVSQPTPTPCTKAEDNTKATAETPSKPSPFVDQDPNAFEVPLKPKEASEATEEKPSFFRDTEVVAGEVVNESSYSQGDAQYGQGSGTFFTVEMLEKMLEDPNMQSMVYPYLPEGMRNPETFKWMLSNPEYRQQLQDMLNKMNNGEGMDPQMASMFKDFDMNSDEVKQQFDAMGMTPDQVIQKIMQNPELAMAFQNPKVQKAIMECSQNPAAIFNYQNDPEVMNVFQKISELFPQAGGAGMGMPGFGGPGFPPMT